jgi:hypothetical protein
VCVRACVEVGCQTWRDRRCNRRYGKCSGDGGGTFTGSCVCARLKPAVPRCMCAVARVQRAGKRDNRTDTQKTHALPTNTPLQTPTRRKRDFSQVSARCPVLVRSIGSLQLYSFMLKLLKVQSMRAPRAERFGACNIPSNMPHGKKKKNTAR